MSSSKRGGSAEWDPVPKALTGVPPRLPITSTLQNEPLRQQLGSRDRSARLQSARNTKEVRTCALGR